MKKIFFVVLCSTPLCLLPMEERVAVADKIKRNSTQSAGSDKTTQDVLTMQPKQNETLKANAMGEHENNEAEDAKREALFKQLQIAGMADNPEDIQQVLKSMQAKAKL